MIEKVVQEMADSRTELQRRGWTFRPRWEDNDPEKPIIGVRLTNAAKIFETAQTIQIFDTCTVTVQFGFLQEQSVSLTREDGAEFIDWLKATHPELAAPMLAIVPVGDRTPGPAAAGMNTAKGELVAYLAKAYPEVFGRGGRATMTGADFYAELLELFKDPERDSARTIQLILAVEGMAHDFYSDCNAALRRARALGASLEAAAEAQMDAYGYAMAAQRSRDYAEGLRIGQPLDLRPPVAAYPEAIEPHTIPIVAEILARGAGATDFKPLAPGLPPPVVPVSETLASAAMRQRVKPGDILAVVDPTHAKFRQMGKLAAIRPLAVVGDRLVEMFSMMMSGATELEDFTAAQLMKP